MADIGKNGFGWTGHTEPFNTPILVSSATALSSVDYSGMGAGIVAIENTQWINSGLYVRPFETGNLTSFVSKDLNIDTRMDESFTDHGSFVLYDGSTYVTVDGISYNNVTDEYTVTVSAAIDVVQGKALKVVGRKVDVGNTTASIEYEAGRKIVELYIPSEVV